MLSRQEKAHQNPNSRLCRAWLRRSLKTLFRTHLIHLLKQTVPLSQTRSTVLNTSYRIAACSILASKNGINRISLLAILVGITTLDTVQRIIMTACSLLIILASVIYECNTILHRRLVSSLTIQLRVSKWFIIRHVYLVSIIRDGSGTKTFFVRGKSTI